MRCDVFELKQRLSLHDSLDWFYNTSDHCPDTDSHLDTDTWLQAPLHVQVRCYRMSIEQRRA